MEEILDDGMDALPSRYGWRDVHGRSQVQVQRAGWDNTMSCSEHRKCPWSLGREHSTLVWGEDEATGGGRLIERLKEALNMAAEVECTQMSSA